MTDTLEQKKILHDAVSGIPYEFRSKDAASVDPWQKVDPWHHDFDFMHCTYRLAELPTEIAECTVELFGLTATVTVTCKKTNMGYSWESRVTDVKEVSA